MLKFSAYHPEMAANLLALWHEATADAHPITPALWEAITRGDPAFEAGDLLIATRKERPGVPLGFVLAKPWRGGYPGCERYEGQAWITLMAVAPHVWRQGVGRSLLTGAQARLQARGVQTVGLGASFHHAMPGVPSDWADARAFFAAAGYAELPGLQWDVQRDLGVGRLPTPDLPPGVVLRPYTSGEAQVLEAFLGREFPGRWPRDAAQALAAGISASDFFGAFRNDEPVGFAHLHPPGSPGAQRWAGFDPGVAALGPIGVGAAARGLGLGLAVLLGGLHHLRDAGARSTVIDWTDLLDFYARAGFAPWRSYVQAKRNLL